MTPDISKRVCITSVGRKVALVQAFKDAGWWVIGKDRDTSVIGLTHCHELAKDEGATECDLIVPTRDAELLNYAGLPFSASRETIETCLDKVKFYHWCKAHGFRTPEIYFVKPRVSQSGKETECVWQELVEGEEYSVDLFADFKGKVISIVPRLRLKTLSGESVISRTVQNSEILLSAKRLSEAVGLIGHNVLQCFHSNSIEPVWTDVNCRFGGGSIVAIKAGCRSPEWLLRLVRGESIIPCIGEYKIGLTGMSYANWEFYE